MLDLEPISVRQPRLSFPHVDDFLTSIMKHFKNLSFQSSLTTNTFISRAKMFYLHSLTAFNKSFLLNLQNLFAASYQTAGELGAEERLDTARKWPVWNEGEDYFIIILKNLTHQHSPFFLNITTTGTKPKVTFSEHCEQQLLCREEMQTGLEVVCGAMEEKGDYPQDLLLLLPDAWHSKLLHKGEIFP